MSERINFRGKRAIVTGAGGGVGRGHALLLASRGARVVADTLATSGSGQAEYSRLSKVVLPAPDGPEITTSLPAAVCIASIERKSESESMLAESERGQRKPRI